MVMESNPTDLGERQISEWRVACLRQIESAGGDVALAAEIERLAVVLLREYRARVGRAESEKDSA